MEINLKTILDCAFFNLCEVGIGIYGRKKQMKKTTLLIMAAGIGSRFGTGIKQLEPVGLHDEIIMDYSIHDAISAGFNKIIFVIRKDIE